MVSRYGASFLEIWYVGAVIKNVIEHVRYIIINSSMMGRGMQQASMNGFSLKKVQNCGKYWKNLTGN